MNDRTLDGKKLSDLLNLPIIKNRNFEYGLSMKVNDFQWLFVRFTGYRGNKGFAQLHPAHDIEGVRHQDVYYGKEATIDICFNPDKALDKIASDIQRRILFTPEATKALDIIKERVNDHREFNNKTNNRIEFLRSLGFGMGSSYGSLSVGKRGYIKVYTENNNIEFSYLDKELYEKVLKFISKELKK